MPYSYSFDPELDQDRHWTERYATQAEIHGYLRHVADRFALWPSILLQARVDTAAWDEAARRREVSTDIAVDPAANEHAAEFVRRKIRETVADPGVAEMLTPRDHPIFGRRPCVDTDYYRTFNRPNTELVNLRATPVLRFEETGVRTTQRLHELDAVVFATGFDAITGALMQIDIRGAGGRTLAEKWADGPRTHLGLMTHGFPNMFMIPGPGSPGVLSNVVVSIEQHVGWIGDLLEYTRNRSLDTIEPTLGAEEDWMSEVARAADATLVGRTRSWYAGCTVPGKPQVFMPYSGGVGQYRKICDRVARAGYPGLDLTPGCR